MSGPGSHSRNPVRASARWLARRFAREQKASHSPDASRGYKLIVGLGNPGIEYARNRHNVGFLVLDRFAESHSITFSRRRFNARLAEGVIEGRRVLLAKPQTYMNLSGSAVGKLVSFHQIPIHDIIVVYDDLDLPLGRMRLRARGGAGGHHGMESIVAALGHADFARLRIGIGRPASREDVDHVLGNFNDEERSIVEETVTRAVEALDIWLTAGIEEAMNRFNA
jgi:PTH1 family peptidyl-tRNA hydrolase